MGAIIGGVMGEDPGEGHLWNVKWMNKLNTGNKQYKGSNPTFFRQ